MDKVKNIGEKISSNLNEIDSFKNIGEEQIRQILEKFINDTGVRPTSIDLDILDISRNGNSIREFQCVGVKINYNPDSRFRVNY